MIKPLAVLLLSALSAPPAFASSALFNKLSAADLPNPMQILTKIEQQYQQYGQIIEFELEVEKGQLFYEVDWVNGKQLTELLLSTDGQLLEQDVDIADIDSDPELHALAVLNQRQGRFSDYVKAAIGEQPGYLIEAQLEHNIGISYLEIELLTAKGKRKLALDLKTGEPLPILNW